MTEKESYPKAATSGGDTRGPRTADHLSEPVARMVREEVDVAADELRERLREQTRSRGLRLRCGAGVAGLYGGGVLVACAVLLLALVIPAWASTLIVGAVLVGLALALHKAARQSRLRDRSLRRAGNPEDTTVAPVVPGTPGGLGGERPGTVPPPATPAAPPPPSPDRPDDRPQHRL